MTNAWTKLKAATSVGGGSAAVYPTRFSIEEEEFLNYLSDNSPDTMTEANSSYWTRYRYNTGTLNAYLTVAFTLAAGTYTMHVLGASHPNRGKITWNLDGVDQGSEQDWSLSTNDGIDITHSLTVLADGNHLLIGTVTSAGAGATYYTALRKVWGHLTAGD